MAGLGARQVSTPVLNGSNIALLIGGDTPKWTGAASGVWSTTAVGTPFNWKLQTAATNTEFLANDQVIFDDTATGTTSITINDATVTPASFTFNNLTKNYTISGANGITSGLLAKNGTGSLTISNTNSYTGGTMVNAGTLILNGSLSSTPISVAAGATFSESATGVLGGAASLTTSGTTTLAGNNTHTDGTTLNAGTLNVNTASATGTGTVTINGGTLDNTSGGAIWRHGDFHGRSL